MNILLKNNLDKIRDYREHDVERMTSENCFSISMKQLPNIIKKRLRY